MIHQVSSRVFWLAFLLSIPAICQQAAPAGTGSQVLDVQGGKIRVVTVATGLVHPMEPRPASGTIYKKARLW
jgi:hypothetical protein